MQYIPFGKFFDTQTDSDFINAFEEIGHSHNIDESYYLLKNTFDNNLYVVVNYGNGGANWDLFEAWVAQQLQGKTYQLEEVHSKSPDWYADYSIFRIVSEK